MSSAPTMSPPVPTDVVVDRRTAHDWRTLWRWCAAALLPIGPLSVMIGRLVLPYDVDDPPIEIVRAVLGNGGVVEALSWIGLATAPVTLLGVLTLGYIARRGSPLLATLGTAIAFVAYVNWSAAGNLDLLALTMNAQGYSNAEVSAVGSAISSGAFGSATGLGWVVGHIVGTILLAIALGRAHIVGWIIAVPLMLSQPVHFIATVIIPSRLLDATLGWGLTTLCYVAVAIAVVRMSNDRWDLRPPEGTQHVDTADNPPR